MIQVVERVLKALLGHPSQVTPKRSKNDLGTIVVAHDLSPSDTINFKSNKINGFVTDVGGATSHTAIVARSLDIPAVVGLRHIRHTAREDDIIIIDGTRGVVIIDPDERVLEEYRLRRSELAGLPRDGGGKAWPTGTGLQRNLMSVARRSTRGETVDVCYFASKD